MEEGWIFDLPSNGEPADADPANRQHPDRDKLFALGPAAWNARCEAIHIYRDRARESVRYNADLTFITDEEDRRDGSRLLRVTILCKNTCVLKIPDFDPINLRVGDLDIRNVARDQWEDVFWEVDDWEHGCISFRGEVVRIEAYDESEGRNLLAG